MESTPCLDYSGHLDVVISNFGLFFSLSSLLLGVPFLCIPYILCTLSCVTVLVFHVYSIYRLFIVISDPRRGCYMGLSMFIFFPRHDFVRAISLEPLLAETPNSVCCLVLRSNCALLLTIQFASLFFFIYFFFFRQDFVRAISLEPLLAETPN